MMSETVTVAWYCGYFYGSPKWHGTEIYEPDECGAEFSTEVEMDDWENECASATCPRCGAVLYQSDDCPVIKGDLS